MEGYVDALYQMAEINNISRDIADGVLNLTDEIIRERQCESLSNFNYLLFPSISMVSVCFESFSKRIAEKAWSLHPSV
jgi:hypothetical protein